MNLDPSIIGSEWDAGERFWDATDAILYALGVGAGQCPSRELAFTTENSTSHPHQVLPGFATALVGGGIPPGLSVPLSALIHAEEQLTQVSPLPASGLAHLSGRILDIQDKGRDALLVSETVLTDPTTGGLWATVRSTALIRGHGGFGGPRGASVPWFAPRRQPDHVVKQDIRPEQALIYRLSGDRNPLHSDPDAAKAAGFDRPILHGLCVFGIVSRLLLNEFGFGHAANFGCMKARFSAPVYTGQTIDVSCWKEPDGTYFRASVDGRVVLDRGVYAPASS